MDSQSLDSCIQKTLSSLYHPFESTAATLLCQVLDVVEKTYRGDGLSYLIDFLIPAKRILQGLQQEACLQYCGLLFRHAGWPLCIHDKIVLQLASVDWRLLQPGDFYLQVVPYLRKTPRIVLKCLAQDLHNIEEVVLPDSSYTSIFTLEWLEFINSERIGASLANCLVTSDDQLLRVPWDMVVHPEFVQKTSSVDDPIEICETPKLVDRGYDESTEPPMGGLMVKEDEVVHDNPTADSGPETVVDTLDGQAGLPSEIEGEYVELRDLKVPRFGPQMGSLTQSIALNYKSQHKSTQRSKTNQTLDTFGGRRCFDNLIHRPLPPPDQLNIMGASVTHYAADYAQKPESLGRIDVEFGGRESPCPVHANLSADRGSDGFLQGFSLENEALSETCVEVADADTKAPDNSTTSCEQPSSEPDNFSTSLSFQEENRSYSGECTEEAWGTTDASLEPVIEHSRTYESGVIGGLECPTQEPSETHERNTIAEEIEQSVPLSPIPPDSEGAPLESTKDAPTDSITCSDITQCELPTVEVLSQIVELRDQNTQDATDLERDHDLPAGISGERPEELDVDLIAGDVTERPVEAREQNELESPVCWEENDPSPRCLQYASGALTPLTQLPLETLHEDAEEERGTSADPPAETTSEATTGGDTAPAPGQTSAQGSAPEKEPERDPSLSWYQGPSSPSAFRRTEGQTLPTRVRDVNLEVLMSGVACLPGTRDRVGRALVIINTRNTCWLNPHCNASELGRLLLYFYSIVRRDCKAMGLTLLIDARRCSLVPALFKAIHIVQAVVPSCIHGVLLLAEKDLLLSLERPHGVQFDLLTSTKSLHKHIEPSHLPPKFNGTFPYCHQDWLAFRTKLENLLDHCCDASAFLQNAIHSLQSNPIPEKAEEARLQLTRFDQLMKTVLEDPRLVKLQTEGGAVLARLKKEESCVMLTEDYREAVETAAELYNRVDEGVHSLVRLSNQHIQEMEMVIEMETFEQRFQEVGGWIENVGERLLAECSVLQDSLEVLLQTQRQFKEFEVVACEYCRRGLEMVQSMDKCWDLSYLEAQRYKVKLQKYKDKVDDFSRRVEGCRVRLEKTIRLYQFFDKVYEWSLEGMRRLATVSFDDCSSPELCRGALENLEKYQLQHPEIDEKRFEEMRELAYELKSEEGAKQWRFAWSKCQEARQLFEKKFELAMKAKRAASGEKTSPRSIGQRRNSDVVDQKVQAEKNCNMSYFQSEPHKSPLCGRERKLGRVFCHRPELANMMGQTGYTSSPCGSSASSVASSAFRVRKMSLQSIPGDDHLQLLHHVPSGSSTPTPCRPMGRRLLRKAQSFDLPGTDVGSHGCQRRLSEPARRGNTGVFIKGLEVSSTEMAERPCSPRQSPALDWSAERLLKERRSSVSSTDGRSRSSKLRHIIDEMVTTEREYVRSLWYISENYFPEMDRMDLPQDLRGKRGIIFGNLEKLRDFHSQYFLKELESCCNHPLRVSHAFLRHKDQFGMYALYSKNKPRSDLLLASHGNIFFKNKQRQLGDKMDLSSYLLKPIQRMSKYALLLKDLIKDCSEAQEQELANLRAAEEMVKFQLRHGNDLLAMDAIRDCDVNLKEQGQLVRQDEFTVWLGRRKCQRHVFLFEDLILFSKPKRIEGGLDVYIYKRSFKTADIGLTENSGDSGLRFEIWFRRRKSNDTHILQASNAEIKQAWTLDIAKILWQQATRNKEIRMQEMVSMGVGNKPFLDIKPSDAAINNRAIDYIMKGRGARTRASIAVSLFDHSDPYKRSQASTGCSSAPSACGPSSASVLAPLNLHMYVNQSLLPGALSPIRPFETSSCLEEDELEKETSCSQPSMTTESSESSQCMSGAGSSGSDSGCVSGIPQDNLSEDAASPCDASAQYTFPERRRSSSGVISPVLEKSRFINQQYISANPALSPSTIV